MSYNLGDALQANANWYDRNFRNDPVKRAPLYHEAGTEFVITSDDEIFPKGTVVISLHGVDNFMPLLAEKGNESNQQYVYYNNIRAVEK